MDRIYLPMGSGEVTETLQFKIIIFSYVLQHLTSAYKQYLFFMRRAQSLEAVIYDYRTTDLEKMTDVDQFICFSSFQVTTQNHRPYFPKHLSSVS